MCTIAIMFGVADSRVVLAANRDELYEREARPPERLSPAIVGGVDVVSGGTWLAVTDAGRFVAVTNQVALDQPPPGLRSRGLAVRELAAAADPDRYVAAIDPRDYASMNLVWGDADRISIAYLRRELGTKQVEALGPGIHVLCNDRLDAPGFPRGDRLERAISAALSDDRGWTALAPRLQRALGDHARVAESDVPASRLPVELARELTATCIHSARYGTRSSTIVALERGAVSAYLHADGPPCITPFVDRLGLLT